MVRKNAKSLVIPGVLTIIFVLSALWYAYPLVSGLVAIGQADGELEVGFFDVGQGDAALIKTPSGMNILIDGGPDSSVLDELAEALPWNDRTIDLMVLTHPHDDHAAGLIPVIERFQVRQVLYTGVVHTSPTYLEWLARVRDYGINAIIADRPQTVDLGDNCRLELLYPNRDITGQEWSNQNNTSIVARLVYGDSKFLFLGDAEAEVEQELLAAKKDLSAQVVKIAHHGSNTSSSEDFLRAISPEYAVISVGLDNTFGHPSPRVINRLARSGIKVLRTDESGTVRFLSDGRQIELAAD